MHFNSNISLNGVGSLNSISFDITDYGGLTSPFVGLDIYEKTGSVYQLLGTTDMLPVDGSTNSVTYNGIEIRDPWSANSTKTFDLSSFDLSSINGSSDEYRFSLKLESLGSGFVGIDHVRVYGDVTCVPEPSTSLLFLLSGVGIIFNRRREK